ncbi:MAG: hypothetical protein KGH71_05555 [Candidatus Micrarchaeota archaeon]|nr:hypothetical protein [Candidatus Micrarchaeota archaeon]
MRTDFITSNPLKLRIANEALDRYGVSVKQRIVQIKELQSFDIEEVALDKAKQAMVGARRPFIVSDDGFYINGLEGFPGALLKYVIPKIGDNKLLRLVDHERGASFVNVIVFGDPRKKSFKIFSTTTKGKLAIKATGSRKIGWAIERIFIPKGSSKSIAQFSDSEWNTFWKRYIKNLHYTKLGQWIKNRA